ncbi:MAG: molybdopterin oxidoreductase family protein, partial [Deltaproteobacteria bacterium]|nr:molybdopterin oxidoreductase family protein [Deltaproteobacteria bacterium]
TARTTGIDPATVRRVARELAAAPRAAVYGRLGTTCQEFGTLSSWAVDLLNYLTGNLDREGGVMFPLPAALRGGARKERAVDRSVARLGERRSRIGGLPYLFGELPAATIADEILTPGEGQLRALVTVAGNPARSVPGSARIEEALASLEHLVCVDFYLNETTRHASVILPPPAPLERETYDLAFYQLSVRNVAKYSLAAVPRPADQPDEWQILLRLAAGLLGLRDAPLEAADGFVFSGLVDEELSGGELRFAGLDADEARAALGEEPGPRRILDLWLRSGPYGDGFGRDPGGLSLAKLLESPHGVDLGALTPGLPAVLQTADRKIDLFPPIVAGDLPRLAASLDRPAPELVLVGRRHLRSNNSWLHNVRSLAKGPERCTLLMHPADATARGLVTGALVKVSSRVGEVVAPLETSDDMRPGVVSLPHGFGHDAPGARMSLAAARPGANMNRLTDPARLDVPSGNAALNGEPVSVGPA